MTNEPGLEFEHLEQTGPSREEIAAALDKLDEVGMAGFIFELLGHYATIRAVLTQALELAK